MLLVIQETADEEEQNDCVLKLLVEMAVSHTAHTGLSVLVPSSILKPSCYLCSCLRFQQNVFEPPRL